MNLNKIKMMVFDFDDTLLIHYKEKSLDSNGEDHRKRLISEQIENNQGYQIYDKIGVPNNLVQRFLEMYIEITKNTNTPKYCISWVKDSLTLPFKKEWLEKHFPGQFNDVIGVSTPERKITVAKILAEAYGINPENVLVVDDYFVIVDEAHKAGFCAMSVQELMLRTMTMYE